MAQSAHPKNKLREKQSPLNKDIEILIRGKLANAEGPHRENKKKGSYEVAQYTAFRNTTGKLRKKGRH